jgi:osmotically inducible protein OsmC
VQLFASGYSACFLGAMGLAAKNLKKTLPKDTAIDAKVSLNKNGDKLGLQVVFNVTGSGDKAELKRIVDEAHTICPYSNATRGNVDVQLNVV